MAKKISKKVKAIISEYLDILQEEIKIEKVFLFGSHAKGTARNDSDIDIAIISGDFKSDLHEAGKYLMRKLWKVKNSNIEPIPYAPSDFKNDADSPLISEIKKHGIEIAF